MFLEQELLATPTSSHPALHEISELKPFEVEGKRLFELPSDVKLCLADNDFMSSMVLNMYLSKTSDGFMYTTRFGILGNDDYQDALGDYDTCKAVSDKEGSILFGIRIEPETEALGHKRLIDMRGEGLPGFWHVTFGFRRKEMMKIFGDLEDDD